MDSKGTLDSEITLNNALSFLNTLFAFCALIVSMAVLYLGYWIPRMTRKDALERLRLERRAWITQIGNAASEVEFRAMDLGSL